MPRYAERTDVGSDRSKAEIERTLTRYGADQFAFGWDQTMAIVGFRMKGRMIRLRLPLPPKEDFRYSPGRRLWRDNATMLAAWEQGTRQRWRALSLVIKAKLEAVEAGISTVEDEFLGATMLPDGGTVSDWLQPQLEHAYETRQMPAMLPGLDAPQRQALPAA